MSESLTEFCRLSRRRLDLKDKLADVERSLDAMRPGVVDEVHRRRVNRMPGFSRYGVVLSPTSEPKVKAIGDTDDLVSALKKSCKKELLGVNWPALIAWTKRARTIPEAIAQVLDVRMVDGVSAKRKKRGDG